jgi:F-box and leucine-rich repeat protein 1 (S-phase kinase-associated protein 2)
MSENSNHSKTIEDEKDSSSSVTIYEDETDINYYHNAAITRILGSSATKRSPLASINSQAGSSSKTPSKLDESFVKRLQPKESQPDPFQYLSDEILLHIFTFLPKKTLSRLAQVNERFCRVSQDESLWIRMDLGNKPLRAGAVGRILERGLIILRLAQAKIKSPIFEPLFDPEGFMSKLQYLDLSMAAIDTTSLVLLLSVCKFLKKLSLEAVAIDNAVCEEIAKNEAIEVLNLSMCEGLTLEGVAVMMIHLTRLMALNISWTQLKADAVEVLVNQLTPTIMRLNIAGCRKSLMDKRENFCLLFTHF